MGEGGMGVSVSVPSIWWGQRWVVCGGWCGVRVWPVIAGPKKSPIRPIQPEPNPPNNAPEARGGAWSACR